MVGLVIVSHSAKLAEGVAELAAQMTAPEVRIAVAGGLDEPGALGTDAGRVVAAIEEVWSGDGVLVLLDLGSAVLSAQLATDLLGDDHREHVLLTAAPLVEGAVAAAVAAGLGDPLEAVAEAARGGLSAKREQLGDTADDAAATTTGGATEAVPGPSVTGTVVVRNRLGLHARPAALLVRSLAALDARVTLSIPARDRGPADARSLIAVGSLGVRGGETVLVSAAGAEAQAAVDIVRRLADEGFGEPGDLVGAPAGDAHEKVTPREGQPSGVAPMEKLGGEAVEPPSAGSVLRGLPASPGLASGPARLLHRAVREPSTAAKSDPQQEWQALEAARGAVARDLRRSQRAVESRLGPAEAAIFGAHLLLLDDPELLEPARRALFERGASADRAWADALASAAAAWEALDDPYQRERAADVRDVGAQVSRRLALKEGGVEEAGVEVGDRQGGGGAEGGGAKGSAPPERPVVVVDELTPADVAGFSPGTVAGIACASGGPTSHAVILARALGVPMVVGAGEPLLGVVDGTALLVDGDEGTVTVRPPDEAVAAVERRRRRHEHEAAAAASLAAEPGVTLDGVRIAVEANVSGAGEAFAAVAAGADGVGLLRTEFLFLDAPALPNEDEQVAACAAVAAALRGRPLTIRTLDAGADKPLPALPLLPETNPFLGVRGLRLSLQYPEQLCCQLRAVLRTAATHPVRVMFPMVAEVDELRRARGLLDEARAELVARGAPVPERLEVGVMLEVPSAALLAEQLAPLADFFSVGTNDLTQYTLAAERGNAGVAALGDALHPAVLRLIERAASAALAAGRTVAVCGEVAGDPAAVPLLLGLGVRELSMSAVRIAAAKQAVRRTDLAAARRLAEEALALDSAAAVRRLLAPGPSAR